MSIKIFLPISLFDVKQSCELYGEIQINECSGVSYFIIGAITPSSENIDLQEFRHLGFIRSKIPNNDGIQHRDVALSFVYDHETPHIHLDKVNIRPSNTNQANLFLYNAKRILKLQNVDRVYDKPQSSSSSTGTTAYANARHGDIETLYRLLEQYQHNTSTQRLERLQRSKTVYPGAVISWIMNLISTIFAAAISTRLIRFLLKSTVLMEHHKFWQQLRSLRHRRHLNVSLDRCLGIIVMVLLLVFTPQGDYLIQGSHLLIHRLRLLLGALKGNPVGLKLNEHLNNFFLDCFNYHIDLWSRFLDLIEPLVRHLLLPIAFIGPMGLSFQLALLSDLISVIGLHTHCFYIYAAVLYKVEIKGLTVLWKVVLGKRFNVLKGRVESHGYMNRQLFLATLFFTALLFLLPTILVYYAVFTTLRLCIQTLNWLLGILKHCILNSPIELFCMWAAGNLFVTESIQLVHEPHAQLLQSNATPVHLSVFRIEVHPSTLSRVFVLRIDDDLALKRRGVSNQQGNTTSFAEICKRILAGTF